MPARWRRGSKPPIGRVRGACRFASTSPRTWPPSRPLAACWSVGQGQACWPSACCSRCPAVASCTLLDFSTDVLSIGRERLVRFQAARFVPAKSPDWVEQVDRPFDCVVSMQAVHELRNKRHALRGAGFVSPELCSRSTACGAIRVRRRLADACRVSGVRRPVRRWPCRWHGCEIRDETIGGMNGVSTHHPAGVP